MLKKIAVFLCFLVIALVMIPGGYSYWNDELGVQCTIEPPTPTSESILTPTPSVMQPGQDGVIQSDGSNTPNEIISASYEESSVSTSEVPVSQVESTK